MALLEHASASVRQFDFFYYRMPVSRKHFLPVNVHVGSRQRPQDCISQITRPLDAR